MKPDDRKVFFVNGSVDFLLIGGLSILGAMACLALEFSGRRIDLTWWVFALAWVVNWPHFAATNFRLYRSRANMAQYPATAFGVPALILCMTAAAFVWPGRVAPALVKLFMLWSPFHFSGQTLGLSLLYARRAGMTVGRLDRAAFSGFIFSTYLWLVIAQDTEVAPGAIGGVYYPNLGLPTELATAALIGVHVCGLLMLLSFGRACLSARRLLPPIILLPAIAQYVWYIAGSRLPAFNLFIPLFHSLQYLLIAWAVQLKERMDERKSTPSAGFVLRESAVWGVLNVAIGAGLFWLLPRAVALAGVPLALSIPVFYVAVQIHHFFVDGVIWKLRNAKVDQPLRVTLDDLLRTSA